MANKATTRKTAFADEYARNFRVGLKRRHKAGELSGDIPRPSMTGQSNHPWPAAISGCLELLAELGRILNAWDTEFTRAAEEVQARRIERN